MSLEQLGHTILEFIKLHQAWAAPIVFALAFAESLALLSFLVPAWAVMVGIGAMM
jgi:membrane protein DedA with SNARE-associated domain